MTELKWIEDMVVPETSEDAVQLLKIIDEFSKFPNNFVNARHKRFSIIIDQMKRIVDIEFTNTMVADVADHWLRRLEYLLEVGREYGTNKWYQKGIRKTIRGMKKDIDSYPQKIIDSDNYWFSYTAKEIMSPWKESMKKI
jgi:hypothetical protein